MCDSGHSVGQSRDRILAAELGRPRLSNLCRRLAVHCGNPVVAYLQHDETIELSCRQRYKIS